jgi:hypothetical protein
MVLAAELNRAEKGGETLPNCGDPAGIIIETAEPWALQEATPVAASGAAFFQADLGAS